MGADSWRVLHGAARCESTRCPQPSLTAGAWAYVTERGGFLFCRPCAESKGFGQPPEREGQPAPVESEADAMSRFDREAFRRHLWEKIQAGRRKRA